MAYRALEQMRERNRARFLADVGPFAPEAYRQKDKWDGLKAAALQFLSERCENLRFDEAKTAQEANGAYQGTSLKPGQIPYNMQMDVERMCLVRELAAFIDSGTAEDAYTVYYAFLKMFLGTSGRSQKMVELLSEFESNASSLLMKHRDHYSHSVYVFALGLAIYETNAAFRKTFAAFYADKVHTDREAAAFFLEYWGMTALFHDIGYPFEIPFEQVVSYFEMQDLERGQGVYLAYHETPRMTALDEPVKAKLSGMLHRSFDSLEQLLAYGIWRRLGDAYGVSEEYLCEKIASKPSHPEDNGYFMDHAYFSAARLFRELNHVLGAEGLNDTHLDVLSAIMLHNSLFKFAINFFKSESKRKAPLDAALHPLAYLLMLCDELQCWDRTAYGRNSRTELHPNAAKFNFDNGEIRARYFYDEEEFDKIREYRARYRAWASGDRSGKPPRLKAYSDMAEIEQRFLREIEWIVNLSDMPLTVEPELSKVDRSSKHTYLSASNFLHMYDFAVALNARYHYMGKEDAVSTGQLEAEFDALSLEYQLSNINQVKSFAKYLNAIDSFYTDKPVDFDMLHAFTDAETAVFAPMEHERWIREHRAMGWRRGDLYETADDDADPRARGTLREQLRMHKLCMDGDPDPDAILAHYEALSEADRDKDIKPFNSMLKLIKKYDGLRIYRLHGNA